MPRTWVMPHTSCACHRCPRSRASVIGARCVVRGHRPDCWTTTAGGRQACVIKGLGGGGRCVSPFVRPRRNVNDDDDPPQRRRERQSTETEGNSDDNVDDNNDETWRLAAAGGRAGLSVAASLSLRKEAEREGKSAPLPPHRGRGGCGGGKSL